MNIFYGFYKPEKRKQATELRNPNSKITFDS